MSAQASSITGSLSEAEKVLESRGSALQAALSSTTAEFTTALDNADKLARSLFNPPTNMLQLPKV